MDKHDNKRNTHRMGRYGYAGGPGGPSRGVGRQAPSQSQPQSQPIAGAAHGVGSTSMASFDTDVLKAEVPVLVDVWATWCGPCKAMAPHLEQLAQHYQGRLRVLKIDGDHNPAFVQVYNVRSYPTLLLFSHGMLVKTHAGSPGSLQGLQAFVEPL